MLSQNAYLDADASVSSGAAEKRRSAHHLRRPRCSCFGKCSLESATPKVELWKCNSSKAFLEACGILPMSTFECSVLFDVYFRVLNLFWHMFYNGQYFLTSVHNAHCFLTSFHCAVPNTFGHLYKRWRARRACIRHYIECIRHFLTLYRVHKTLFDTI